MSRTFNFFRRAGACSCHRYIRTAEDVCPYSKNAFVMPLTFDFLKSLLCSAREVASSVSEKTVGLFGGRTQFIPTARPFPRTNRRGDLRSPVHLVWTFALSTVLFTLKNNELLNSLHVIFNIKFIWHPFYFRNTDNNFRSQPFCRRNIYKQHYFYYFSTLKSRHSTLSGYLFCSADLLQ